MHTGVYRFSSLSSRKEYLSLWKEGVIDDIEEDADPRLVRGNCALFMFDDEHVPIDVIPSLPTFEVTKSPDSSIASSHHRGQRRAALKTASSYKEKRDRSQSNSVYRRGFRK